MQYSFSETLTTINNLLKLHVILTAREVSILFKYNFRRKVSKSIHVRNYGYLFFLVKTVGTKAKLCTALIPMNSTCIYARYNSRPEPLRYLA